MKKGCSHVLMGLVCFSVMPSLLLSLPKGSEVVSGSANISIVDQNAMIIEVEDQSIINYKSFDIAVEERVHFVQPSSSSIVLNRVTGNDASEILGKMSSNGKVFLVNPKGVFFGSEAQVDMGSLITSTLDIADSDFLNGNFKFTLEEGKGEFFIVNQGRLRAFGDVALIASNVSNKGTIIAHAGRVLLASGEKVVLDFIGDGLMQFSLEGSLEKAMIQQEGSIEALQGQVHLTMSHVKQVIQNVINTEGIEVGGEIVEENGVIHLLSTSKIFSREVYIAAEEGSKVEVRGEIDVSNIDGIGGSIYVFGEEISIAANLNATGAVGGGEILIGGDAFGQGSYFTAKSAKVQPGSILTADAAVAGNGGKIVVWSNKETFFDGIARSRGGILGGDGGFIETSGKMGLALAFGRADTSAPLGKVGTWLLDPFAIVINNTGTDSLSFAQNANDITSTVTINASIFANSTSNVTLSAMAEGGSITVAEDTIISMAPGYGITFSVDPENGDIFLANNSQVKTEGGSITFNGKVTLSGDQVTLVTNGNGAFAPIHFASTVDGTNGVLSNLTLETGSLTFSDAVGANSALGQLTIKAGLFNLGTNIFTKGQDVSIMGPTVLVANAKIDSTSGDTYLGGDIFFKSTVDGPYALLVEAGQGTIHFDADVGSSKALYSFNAKGSKTIVSGSFLAEGNTLRFEGPVVIGANVTFTDHGTSGVFFLSTVNGDGVLPWNLTVNAPVGTAYFIGAVGGLVPLAGLTVSASEIVQVNKVTLLNSSGSTSALSYSALLGITVEGDILAGATNVSSGILTFNNSVLFKANIGSVTTAGTVKLAVLSDVSTASSVEINGVSIGSDNLHIDGDTKTSISLENGVIHVRSLNIEGDSITQDINSSIFAKGSITLDASNGASLKRLSTAASINTTEGTLTLKGGAITATVASNIYSGDGNVILQPASIPISYQGVIQTLGGNVTANAATSGLQDLLLTGDSKINVGDGSVTLNELRGAYTLSILGEEVSSLTFSKAVGTTLPLAGLDVEIGSITQSAAIAVAGSVEYKALDITLAGNIVGTSSGNVTIVGPTTLTGAVTISSGNNISFSGNSSTIMSPTTARALILTPGASGIVILDGAIGTSHPLASLSVTAGAEVNIGSNITVASTGAIAVTPAVVLTDDVTMTSGSGSISFSSSINGTKNFNINTGGGVSFGGDVGGVNYLSSLNVMAGAITVNSTAINVVGGETVLNGPIALGSNVSFKNDGTGVAFLGAITGSGTPSLTVNSPTGLIRIGGHVVSVGHITLTGLDIDQVGNITSAVNSNVTIAGSNSVLIGANTTVTGTGLITMYDAITLKTNVTLTAASGDITLTGVKQGGDGLTIATGSGAIHLNTGPYGLSFLTASSSGAGSIIQDSTAPINVIGLLTLSSTGGQVTTRASLISEGGNISLSGTTLDITSNMATTGGNISWTGVATYHGGSIATGNGNLTVDNDLVLATANTTISIGSGKATFSGTIAGTALTALNLSISGLETGTVSFLGAIKAGVGSNAYLTSLSLEIGNINQLSSVNINGPLSYNALAGISLGGDITTQASGSGSVKMVGPITLTSNLAITTSGYAEIAFVGSKSTINGAFSLDLNAGNSTIYLEGAIGGVKALSSFLTKTSANTLISSLIATTGLQRYGDGSGFGNIVLKGPSRISTINSAITFFGKINGFQTLYVDAGSGLVTYNAAVGGITPLKALDTVSGSVILNAPIKLR